MLRNQKLIDQLTLPQKASLMSGQSTWESFEIPGLVPKIFFSDGPHGIRKQAGAGDHLGLNASLPATCFPTAATLANSWDEALIESVGVGLGAQAAALDVQVVLGPGLNIKRNPKCGRNFEYFSEDPYLAGKMAAASIRGIQANGTMACPKHFAVNNQENRRMALNACVDERTLREIYTTNFEIAVKAGQPQAIMSAYNLVNGHYANENSHLLQDILRTEWQFPGFVVSDWGGDNDHVAGVAEGSNLAMPTLGVNGAEELIAAVDTGALSEADLDQRVDEFLQVILNQHQVSQQQTIDWDKAHQLAKTAAVESIVLLQNQGAILPLASEVPVALIGDFAKTPRYQGAGSSVVNTKQLESTLDVINDYPINVVGYAQGYQRNAASQADLEAEAMELTKGSEVVLLYLGLDEISESEGVDRTTLALPANQIHLLQRLLTTGKPIVAVLSAGSVITCPEFKQVAGLVHGYLGGEAGASAMLEVLCGRHNPSGHLAETYPVAYQDVLFGAEFPTAQEQAYYKEAIFVGYRYYETAQIPVQFPFGYGLSYTEFTYEDLPVTEQGVEVTVTNSGKIAGGDVVQLYVGKPTSNVIRPAKELKGFQKVYLEAGQQRRIHIPFDEYTFRFYDTAIQSWQVEAGTYQMMVGHNVHEIAVTSTYDLKTGVSPTKPPASLANYYDHHFDALTTADFTALYGTPLPENTEVTQLSANNIMSDMQFAKSGLARLSQRLLAYLLKRHAKKGQPDLNLLFIYNMPFRAMTKMTNGAVDTAMLAQLLNIVNGHFFTSIPGLWRAYRANKRRQRKAVT
ncbi:glucocerebrosidase [Agrilactobacillus composti DSM 18527 = JCM 14202]|uniref:Glucocerebrosidase n=1 Tax=Agrilactobacillus composti DSM 18527 = JCM 14202 TaxID=1423734 RepID=X0PG75_9LACO|nr:glycoside hydrolase family 3 C-terminal domain-containing protein [Agrilactobacillus composti]KRM35452.1 glucocerebrosidase [Agrilactobacillus composti DSM 18527 = JCM 14202]GAF40974.1 beta-glucosidase [Agrilactobacillus composti DSM 18527 = JCM 14202]